MELPQKFDNILNFRDVGSSINDFTKNESLREGLLYRSARPDTATSNDRNLLLSTYHIRTVIDLRSKTEHMNAAKKQSNTASLPPAVPGSQSTSTTSAPLKIPNIDYKYFSLNGPGFERALLWQLSWSSRIKLIGLMALGYRDDAIQILGREVMKPRGLTGLGMDTLDHSQREIKQVFDVLANESGYPVMVHCTQGKDRTGLIVLLALLLCGVRQDAIRKDYVMSEKELESEKEERLVEIKKVGLDESFAGCPDSFVDKIVQHINQRYGGVENYLTKIGVGKVVQQKVREILMQKI